MSSEHAPRLLILIVDDDPDTLDMLTTHLQFVLPDRVNECYVGVIPVLDGRSALTTLSQRRCDLVVTDLSMGPMDGYTLIREIRNGVTEIGPESTPRTVPIIVLAVLYEQERMRLADMQMVDAMLGKPCPPDELAGAVVKLLRAQCLPAALRRERGEG